MSSRLLLLGGLLFSPLVLADRIFTIKNQCSYTIWPAVQNFPIDGSALYSGVKGWKADVSGSPGPELR
jgi:hypothetical protein